MAQATKTELSVNPREVLGKKVKRLRREGVTPANVYGHGIESVAVQVPTEDLVRTLRQVGRTEIVYLRLDGEEPRPVFVKAVQRDPILDVILHVDFLQISLKEKVRLEVPFRIVGKAPAVEKGGIVTQAMDRVTVEALPSAIPSEILADVSGLEEIEQALHVSDLPEMEGVDVVADPEMLVVTIALPAKERAEDEEVEGEEELEEGAEVEEGAEEEGEAAEAAKEEGKEE
jgi:large subunit ribosomal protein L25